MKSNDSPYNGGSLEPAYYQAYAQYLAAYIQNYQSMFGVTIDGVSLQNEPDQNQPYESCLWTSQEFHDFIAQALIPTFQADSITAKVIMPEFSGWSDALAADTLADPTTAAAVDVIASHDYSGTIAPFTDALADDKQVWETEVSNLGTNDPTIVDGLNWAITIQNTL
jgi:O-glycosyl hydrolase